MLTADPADVVELTQQLVAVDSVNPVPVTVQPDGSFTSGPITLNNDEYWYAGRHYVAVSLSSGINADTEVYQVSVP